MKMKAFKARGGPYAGQFLRLTDYGPYRTSTLPITVKGQSGRYVLKRKWLIWESAK